MAGQIEAMVRALLNPMGPSGPSDPRWIGNRHYGAIFDAVDQANQQGIKNPKFNLKSSPLERNDINPNFAPDYRGISPTGFNRVI